MLVSSITARLARLGRPATSWLAAYSTQVVVQPLGDSISEGAAAPTPPWATKQEQTAGL
jgi:hypothetical protein